MSVYYSCWVYISRWIIKSRCQHRSPWPSLTTSLSSIAPRKSSRQYIVSVRSSSYPTFGRPCEGVHWSISLMSSSLLLQQCHICLVHLIWIVFVIGGKCLYNCCFVGYCLQDLFSTARNILVKLPSSFFSIRLVSVHVVHPYTSINTAAAR